MFGERIWRLDAMNILTPSKFFQLLDNSVFENWAEMRTKSKSRMNLLTRPACHVSTGVILILGPSSALAPKIRKAGHATFRKLEEAQAVQIVNSLCSFLELYVVALPGRNHDHLLEARCTSL